MTLRQLHQTKKEKEGNKNVESKTNWYGRKMKTKRTHCLEQLFKR